jgi:hypothetical protein
MAWPTTPVYGRTRLSDQINAEANYVAACGYMARSVAEARKINAEAVAVEIQNSVEFVKAYYEGRRIHDEEWKKKHPDEWEREEKLQAKMRKRVNEQYQYILKHGDGSMTDVLNWLLQELSNSVTSLQYVFNGKSPLQPEADVKLTAEELRLIQLTDGGHGGSRLVFSPADGSVLMPKWPLALRGHECDAARDQFDRARNAVVKDVQAKRTISAEDQDKLIQAVNGLYVALDVAYPSERRLKHAEFLDYSAGKQFIQSLVAATHRVITINDASVLNGQLRFQGGSLFALVQHMHRNGLQFAKPQPGAERVYRTMFENLRAMYVNLAQEPPAANPQPRDENGAKPPPNAQEPEAPKKDRNT